MITLSPSPLPPERGRLVQTQAETLIDEANAQEQLKTHLEWSSGPTFAFLFADNGDVLRRLRERTAREVQSREGRVRILRPENPQALREIVRELMTGGKVELLWLEGPVHKDDVRAWEEAWKDVLVRLNERRESLRKHLGGSLVVAMGHALKPVLRATAPDLWSIRSMSLDVGDKGVAGESTNSKLSDQRAWRANAYLIAEALSRVEYHRRMRQTPWFALVLGDDEAPRRRLQDALVGRGFSLLVHRHGPRQITAATPRDLHWVVVEKDPDPSLLDVLVRGGNKPSRPVILEGPLSLEQRLSQQLPELYQTVAFVVRLQTEHASAELHPAGPLPVLERTEESVRDVWGALDLARSLERDLRSLAARDEAAARSARVKHLLHAANTLLVQGWTSEAEPLAAEVWSACSELTARDPQSRWLEAEARELQGKVASNLGDPAAWSWYESALEIRRSLAKTRGPLYRRRRGELARCLSEMGDLALENGDPQIARALVNDALAIRRKLARGSDDRETLSDLAAAWSLKGDLDSALEEALPSPRSGAIDAYREALRLREHVAAEEDAPRFRRSLSEAHGKLAGALARSGDWSSARSFAERSLALARSLVALDPQPAARALASVAASRLGDCARALGDLVGAASAYRDEALLRRGLSAEQPANVRLQELSAIAYSKLADVELVLARTSAESEHSVHLGAALDAARYATELYETLSLCDPHVSRLKDLGTTWLLLGDICQARGQQEEMESAYRRVEQIAQDIRDKGVQRANEQGADALPRVFSLMQQLEARGRTQEQAEIR